MAGTSRKMVNGTGSRKNVESDYEDVRDVQE